MFQQCDCQRLLRAACGGQNSAERRLCWEKDGEHREEPFEFTGGIIVISNDDPRGKSLRLGAIASRFAPQEWKQDVIHVHLCWLDPVTRRITWSSKRSGAQQTHDRLVFGALNLHQRSEDLAHLVENRFRDAASRRDGAQTRRAPPTT